LVCCRYKEKSGNPAAKSNAKERREEKKRLKSGIMSLSLGMPDFLAKYQDGKNVPNNHAIYQMSINFAKRP
jgi:hypothetical protein